jgi:hypothetical protein
MDELKQEAIANRDAILGAVSQPNDDLPAAA